jgi:hypothetical protein
MDFKNFIDVINFPNKRSQLTSNGVWYNTVLGGAQGSQKYGTTRSMKKM